MRRRHGGLPLCVTARLAAPGLVVALLTGCAAEPEPVPMPNVVGMTVEEATAVLDDGEVPIEFRLDGRDDPRSVVFGQFPGADEDVTGKSVRLMTRTVFDEAARNCAGTSGTVTDEGRSMVLDMAGDDWGSGDLDFNDVRCVLDELGVPESTWSKMLSTRSLDGAQTDTWGDVRATWRYHPDQGLDVIVEYDD